MQGFTKDFVMIIADKPFQISKVEGGTNAPDEYIKHSGNNQTTLLVSCHLGKFKRLPWVQYPKNRGHRMLIMKNRMICRHTTPLVSPNINEGLKNEFNYRYT
jgi:hypothetical protein